MKRSRLVIAGLAGLAGLLGIVLVGYVVKLYVLPSPTTAADAFFRTLAQDGPDAAWRAAAPDYRTHETRDGFLAVVGRLGLLDFEAGTWSQPAVDGGQASLSGALGLRGGVTVPVKLTLARQPDGAWSVASITSSADGQEFRPLLPDQAAVAKLVRATFVRLAQAIERHDFSSVRDAGSPLLRARVTAAQLAERFAPLAASGANLALLATAEPNFDRPPALNTDGDLATTGTVPTDPPWHFSARYLYLHPEWKLDGLDLGPAPAAEPVR